MIEPTVTDDDGGDGGDVGGGDDDGANDGVDGDGGGGSKTFVHIYSLLSLMSSNKRSLPIADPI